MAQKKRTEHRARINREIEILRLLYGSSAYEEARRRQKLPGEEGKFYSTVRREIGKAEGRSPLDTGSRYVGDGGA